jgi:hypothetical protein
VSLASPDKDTAAPKPKYLEGEASGGGPGGEAALDCMTPAMLEFLRSEEEPINANTSLVSPSRSKARDNGQFDDGGGLEAFEQVRNTICYAAAISLVIVNVLSFICGLSEFQTLFFTI